MPQRDYWWCIIVAKYGTFLFTEIGTFVISDYNDMPIEQFKEEKANFVNQ